jgi:osmotically-inducible protein OsmY
VKSPNRPVVEKAMPDAGADEIGVLVRGAILRDAAESARSVAVEANGPTVILRGNVRSVTDRVIAELVARSCPGVKRVDNRISIQGG